MIRTFKMRVARALAIIAALLSVGRAQAQVTVTMQTTPVIPGAVTLLTIAVDQATGVAGADLVISAPDFVLPSPAETAAATLDFLVASRPERGRIQIAMARAKGLTDRASSILQVPLQIALTAPLGSFGLKIETLKFYSVELATLAASATDGTISVVAPAADLDHDGIPDSWESLHYGGTQATAQSDYDQDGLSDSQEFLAGTDPASANSVFRIAKVQWLDGVTAPTVRVQWEAQPGKDYQVEWSDGPFAPKMSWQQVYHPDIHIDGTLMSWIDDGTRTYPGPEAVPERYYRVVIVTAPR